MQVSQSCVAEYSHRFCKVRWVNEKRSDILWHGIKDSQVLLRNGDLIHVSSGTYKASGEAAWDVGAGALYSATANQRILIQADRPTSRALRSVADCSLKLLKTKSIPPGRKPA